MLLTSNPYEQYRQQGVMTASPSELLLMLYDGCIRQLKLAILTMRDGEDTEDLQTIDISNRAMLKAQMIVQELSSALDHKYDISREIGSIYDFVENTIYETIQSRDPAALEPLIEIMQELQEAWAQAARVTRTGSMDFED